MADEQEQVGEELEALLHEVKATRGVDLTGYKPATLRRRILRRMGAAGMDSDFTRYADLLRSQPQELNALFDSLLINVTSFFRDREAWAYLAHEIIPRIASQREGGGTPIRVWSAGCASGQEPFSIAMLLAEHLGLDGFTRRVKIYATDRDEVALQQARRARYPQELEDVPESLRQKYFQVDNGEAVLHSALRRAVIFGQHDLLVDAPISRVDLLLCRNTLMYFTAEAQTRILQRLHYALADDGVLFLGRAETLLTHADMFVPIEMKQRIFARHGRMVVPRHAGGDAVQAARRRDEDLARQARLREVALDASPVAQIVLDSQRRIAVINQKATVMFPIGGPDLGRELQDLELSYRPIDLRSMLDEALEQRRSVERLGVEHRQPGREVQFLDISLTPAFRDGVLLALTLTFADVTDHHRRQERLQRFSENLETAYEELQSTNEELETTNEELQSANEELETTNEELQAANEETETVNEELRSTNEELEVTNDLLRVREIEGGQLNAFLNSILSSLRIAVAVVGEDLAVQVWNQQATDLWGVRADEVIGRRLTELDIGLPVKRLVEPIQACLAQAESGDGSREMTVDAINRRGHRVVCRVLLTPLKAGPDRGPGVCILIEDTSRRGGHDEAEA